MWNTFEGRKERRKLMYKNLWIIKFIQVCVRRSEIGKRIVSLHPTHLLILYINILCIFHSSINRFLEREYEKRIVHKNIEFSFVVDFGRTGSSKSRTESRKWWTDAAESTRFNRNAHARFSPPIRRGSRCKLCALRTILIRVLRSSRAPLVRFVL